MRSHFGDWYVGFLFLMEISTPFLALHYILDSVSIFLPSLVKKKITAIYFLVWTERFPFSTD